MDPNLTHAVDVACQHQDLIVTALAWIGGSALFASSASWLTARFNLLPGWAQVMLQVFASNFLHAAMGAPKTVQKGETV